MRYALAIATLVLSGVLLLLGIGQRTFLAGPSEIEFPVDTVADTSFAVVDGAQFAKVPGQANVVVQGGEAFVATGATRDIQGWVEPFAHAELSVDTSEQRLLSALVAANADPNAEETPAPTDTTAPAETAAPTETPVPTEASVAEDAAGAEAAGDAGLDPRGSDLWLEERTLEGEQDTGTEVDTLRVPVSLDADQGVLIASDGQSPVPENVSLVWVQDPDTPWAGPLLAAGGLLALVGGVLYLLAFDHDRRGLGPRRGRRGPLQGIRNSLGGRSGRKSKNAAGSQGTAPGARRSEFSEKQTARSTRRGRRVVLPAVGVVVALGLSGCSANYWPDFGPDTPAEAEETPAQAESALAPVPVTDEQIAAIEKSVASVAAEGDEQLDAELLEERFTADALAQRAANYKIRSAIPDYSLVPPTITDEGLEYQLVQSTESWPRTLFLTVASSAGGGNEEAAGDAATEEEAPTEPDAEGENASPSLAMILTQEDPHANYQVSRVIALRGGISMPAAAPAEEGTALLANDTSTLVLPPGEVGAAYAALLQNGPDAPQAEYFDLSTDTLLENYGQARAAEAQAKNEEEGQTVQFSATARQGDSEVIALSTGAGGALVATTVIEDQIADAAGGRFKPQATEAATAVSGLEGEQEKIVQEVAHQLLFYVPSKADGAKIELLGVTSELVEARNS